MVGSPEHAEAHFALAGWDGAAIDVGCGPSHDAIFGIEAGLPGGVTGTGTGGAGGGASSSTGASCSSSSEAELTPRKLVGALSPGSDSASSVVYDADETPQAAFDVAVDSRGKIASCGIACGTLALGGAAPPVTFSGFHAFVARFDP